MPDESASRAPESLQRPLVALTGASRGVGRALACRLARRGARLVLFSRPSAALQRTMTLLREVDADVDVTVCETHLEQPPSVAEAAERALDLHGAPDALVHGAGIIERARVDETDDASWDRQMEVNLSAPFRLTRALLPAMRARGRGRVLFVSSVSAVVGTARQAAYHASKAGQVALMRCLAEELRDSGLMTAALLPGSIDTSMLDGSGFEPRMSPQDVAETLTFFALDAPVAHNGAVIEMFGV